jgi:ribosome assembly protein RRB1
MRMLCDPPRSRAAPQLTVRAAPCDVNVIAWNAAASFMLASGADNGGFRVWDLRTLSGDAAANEQSFVANFTYHRQARPGPAVPYSQKPTSVLSL